MLPFSAEKMAKHCLQYIVCWAASSSLKHFRNSSFFCHTNSIHGFCNPDVTGSIGSWWVTPQRNVTPTLECDVQCIVSKQGTVKMSFSELLLIVRFTSVWLVQIRKVCWTSLQRSSIKIETVLLLDTMGSFILQFLYNYLLDWYDKNNTIEYLQLYILKWIKHLFLETQKRLADLCTTRGLLGLYGVVALQIKADFFY